ncbi:MAG: DUF2332 family protein, partial [Thermocrispum sp.]
LPLVVLTSHAVIYFAEPRRAEFVAALGELARERAVRWVASGPYEGGIDLVAPGRDELSYRASGQSTLAVTQWVDGTPQARVVAQHQHHGKRMIWLG